VTETDSRRSADPGSSNDSGIAAVHLVEGASIRRRPTWFARLARPQDETLVAILLATAALGTAWSGYQASVWGGIQSTQYNVSSGLRTRAMRASDRAARLQLLDVVLFTKWLEARADRHPRLARYYRAHFRREFVPAFEAWQASGLTRASESTPFERPEYNLADARESEQHDAAATKAVAAGHRANEISDGYVFDTVILASVLFFAGAVRPLVSPRARGTILVVAVLLCVWALVRVANEPVAQLDPGARPLLRKSSGAANGH
jgi:hypothetical protein